jgi:hypothetical protein
MKIATLSSLDSLPYFTLEAVKQLIGDESTAAGTIQTLVYRWMKAGWVIPLKKGIYMPRRFYELHRADADFSPAISSILIPQSYVSLEFILQRNGILTDVTYPISAVTFKNTRLIENKLGSFTYHHIKEKLYYGFSVESYSGISFAQATLAKALFDYLYLRPWIEKSESIASELRLNLDEFSIKDQVEFSDYVGDSKSRKMDRILKNLERTLWRH